MRPLLNDMTRCYGHHCSKNKQCHRYTTMRVDPPVILSYVKTMIDDQGHCESFIQSPKGEKK